jgi:hypothetical protein
MKHPLRNRRRSRPRNRRWQQVKSALLAVFIVISPVGVSIATPAPAHAISLDPCSLIPDKTAREICDGTLKNVGGNLTGLPGVPLPGLGDVTGAVANQVLTPLLNQFTKAEADAVISVLGNQVDFVNKSTTPVFSSDWFIRQYALVFGLGAFVALFLFVTRLGVDVKNMDLAGLANTFISTIAFFIIGSLLPLMVGAIVKFTDGVLTPDLLSVAGIDAPTTLKNLENAMSHSLTESGLAILLPLIVLFFGVIGGVLVEFELIFREAGLYVFTAAASIGLALAVGREWTMESAQRIFMGLIGLILLKPLVAFVLMVGFGILLDPSSTEEPFFLAAVMCLLAPFISWATYKRIANHNVQVTPALKQAQRLFQSAAKMLPS